MPLQLSPLYPILDASYLPLAGPAAKPSSNSPERRGEERERLLTGVVRSLAAAGVTLLQYRNKRDSDEQMLRDAAWLRRQAPASLRIVLNDRAHLVQASGCDGVHIGQTDLGADQARRLVGPDRILGLSTHNDEQMLAGERSAADYLAIGPVYATSSKENAEAVVGLDGVRRARTLTAKPLVAIGGIALAHASQLRAAGADSIAVISALFGTKGIESGEEALLASRN